MRAAAVICECNPPHLGHEYVFRKAGEAVGRENCVIAVMSGSTVQRGELALLDKYARAEMLLAMGADLVVENPFPWCSASAEYFAEAGTTVAENMGADTLVFGASEDDASIYKKAASFSANAKGSYANAEGKAEGYASFFVKQIEANAELQSVSLPTPLLPNDLLAIAYCAALKKYQYSIVPQPVKRIETSGDSPLSSASDLRALYDASGPNALRGFMNKMAFAVLCHEHETGRIPDRSRVFDYAFAKYRFSTSRCSATAESFCGVHERLANAAESSSDGASMLSAAASSRYTNARLRRAALYCLLDVTEDALRLPPLFTVLLGANKKGRAYLSQRRTLQSFSVITKPSAVSTLSESARHQYEIHLRADRLFTMCLDPIRPANEFLKRSPVIC